ncbi:MAG: hypothetical protein DRI22_01035 [Caldiserica bacterium]|nr:MAG: hypothetical protein DRI22_01035 [Caldisericota bacterium]
MSELRKVKMKIKEDTAIEIARNLGYEIYKDRNINAYALRHLRGDLVFRRGHVEFGIVNGELVYDSMNSESVAQFMTEYISTELRRRGLTPIIQAGRNEVSIFVNL